MTLTLLRAQPLLRFVKVLEPSFQLLHHLRHRGLFHFAQRQAMRLEGAVAPQRIGVQVGLLASGIEAGIVERVDRADQFAIGKLEASVDDPRRAIKAAGVATAQSPRVQHTKGCSGPMPH